jgi:hypothetical protein
MVRVFVFLAAVQLILVVLALISSLSAERVRSAPRWVWVLAILLLPLIGAVAYFVAGRPTTGRRATGPGPLRPGPPAPDDDPEFLKTLDPDRSRRDRELFERWERDIRQRDQNRADEVQRAEEVQRADERKLADERKRADELRHNEDTPPTEV